MSKRKHNIAYIKPEEPKFLRQLKEAIGYQEGPSVETKKEALSEATEDDVDDHIEEQPVVVVLKSGDLTAEEAAAFEEQKEKEEAEAPADLSKRIIFRKNKPTETDSDSKDRPASKKSKKAKQAKAVLSFDQEEDD